MLKIIKINVPLSEEDLKKQLHIYNSDAHFNKLVMGKPVLAVEDIKKDITEDLAIGAEYCYLCDNGEEVGLIQYLRHNPKDGSPWLGLLLIHHDLQGKGYGSRAFSLFEEMLKRDGLERVRLCVQDGNSAAVAFWKSQGFSIIKSSTDKHGNKIDISEKRWMIQ